MGEGWAKKMVAIFQVARHSFATSLMLNGIPVAFISQAMGHTNSVTTEH